MKITAENYDIWSKKISDQKDVQYKNAEGRLTKLNLMISNLFLDLKCFYIRLRLAVDKNWSYQSNPRHDGLEKIVAEIFNTPIQTEVNLSECKLSGPMRAFQLNTIKKTISIEIKKTERKLKKKNADKPVLESKLRDLLLQFNKANMELIELQNKK
jgi:hypothetical protein